MINPRELLEHLEFDGTKIVIKKLIDIVEELENRLNERDMLCGENLVCVEMKADSNERALGGLEGDVQQLKEKIEKLNTKTDTI